MSSIFEHGRGELMFTLPPKARPELPSACPVTAGVSALVIHTNGEVRFLDFTAEWTAAAFDDPERWLHRNQTWSAV